jgi:hypothetical protein
LAEKRMASRGVAVICNESSWATKAICLRTWMLVGSTATLFRRTSVVTLMRPPVLARPAKMFSSDVLLLSEAIENNVRLDVSSIDQPIHSSVGKDHRHHVPGSRRTHDGRGLGHWHFPPHILEKLKIGFATLASQRHIDISPG